MCIRDSHGLVEGNDLRIFKFLSDALNDFYGSKLQIDCEDSYSGKLTVTATCLLYTSPVSYHNPHD